MIEELIKPIFEILFYQIGTIFVSIFFPRVKVSISINEPKQKWKSIFTYKKKKVRYFYTDMITLIGLIVSVCVVVIVYLLLNETIEQI